jgi:hypothetical protein
MVLLGAVLPGAVLPGAVLLGMVLPGFVLFGVVLLGVVLLGMVLGDVEGTVTTMGPVVGDGARTVMQPGSFACSASLQFPRTSPGTPLSSGVPSDRAAASAGTPRPSTDMPAMIQIRFRFMMSPCRGW